jgi:Polyketide cyclase / dehydrase and lipid transport
MPVEVAGRVAASVRKVCWRGDDLCPRSLRPFVVCVDIAQIDEDALRCRFSPVSACHSHFLATLSHHDPLSIVSADRSLVSSTVSITVRRPRPAVFKWFVPVELRDILLGYGPLPAVVRTTGQTGPWEQPGSRRTVHLADGNTAQEEVTACEPPHYFAYRVSGFTNILRHFTSGAEGQWWFEEAGDSTEVKWSYTFHARSVLTGVLLFPIAKLLWNGYMRVGIQAVKERAEREAV